MKKKYILNFATIYFWDNLNKVIIADDIMYMSLCFNSNISLITYKKNKQL